MLFPLALVGGAAGQHDLSPRFGSSGFWIGAELVGGQVSFGRCRAGRCRVARLAVTRMSCEACSALWEESTEGRSVEPIEFATS